MNYLQATAAIPAALLIALLSGCSSSETAKSGTDMALECTPADTPQSASGYSLQPFCAPQDPGPGNIWFAASGEVLALTGYAFPPASDSDAAFVDGWDVKFTRLLTTIDKIQLSENPDEEKGSQAVTGPLVAEVDGPWAVDLSHSDPSYLPGKGGFPANRRCPSQRSIHKISENGGSSFATDGTRYAFGFDVIAASDQAQNVNLDADALADYQDMVTSGCAVLYVRTATFKERDPKFDGCVTEASKALPATVSFHLCFKSPTSYLPTARTRTTTQPHRSAPQKEHQRGIAFLSNSSVIGQVTIHTDHPFLGQRAPRLTRPHFRSVRRSRQRWSAARAPRYDARTTLGASTTRRTHGHQRRNPVLALLHLETRRRMCIRSSPVR